MVLQIINIDGSHFQGGIITWKYKNNKVYITYKLSFTDRACDSVSISDRTLVNVGGSLLCFGGCSGTLMSSLSYQCTDYSVDENWKYGQRTVILTFPSAQNDSYAFGYSGCCWADRVKSSSGNWLLLATANLSIRADNGRINSSPVSSMQPVITIKQNCSYALKIPVLDEDDDVVRCRLANTVLIDECKGNCNGFNFSILDQKNCILYINETMRTGLYGVALQIEDFQTEHDTIALSSIPLQFMINVNDHNSTCDEKPSLEITASLSSVIAIPPNTMHRQTIIARSASFEQASDQECQTLKVTDAKGCASNPCPNGASCSEQINGYFCTHACRTDSKFGEIAEETCISEMCTECRITDKQHGFSVQLLSLE
ncbi:Hypothetical predicted protein [Mytilus galloprovincialis]|uniref:Uncharacterized protein n=1 Tax=Mytilus galloprovincialis TaxID=29158 RepID=A0A8B6E657_MYTGA|nr:Hypothetical predicted protein [Mytilus galloprovincialis]